MQRNNLRSQLITTREGERESVSAMGFNCSSSLSSGTRSTANSCQTRSHIMWYPPSISANCPCPAPWLPCTVLAASYPPSMNRITMRPLAEGRLIRYSIISCASSVLFYFCLSLNALLSLSLSLSRSSDEAFPTFVAKRAFSSLNGFSFYGNFRVLYVLEMALCTHTNTLRTTQRVCQLCSKH